MCRIIGVLNYKGGTAKTTTVVNLGAGLALRGARVLCVDIDAQGSLATYLGVPFTYTMKHLLLGAVEPSKCIVHARERLDIVPSDSSLLEAEGEFWRIGNRATAYRNFVERIQGLQNGYDFVILDYSPSANLLGESALRYTEEVIVPVAMNYLALIGTRQVVQTLKSIGRMQEHRVQLSLIVPTFYDHRLRKDTEAMETLHRHFGAQVAEPIRMSVKLAEAPGHQKSIYEYAPTSPGALDYARLVERVANHG
jgi:chromosome partitioning protein